MIDNERPVQVELKQERKEKKKIKLVKRLTDTVIETVPERNPEDRRVPATTLLQERQKRIIKVSRRARGED